MSATDAKNTPVLRRTQGEVHSDDTKIDQRDSIDMLMEEYRTEDLIEAHVMPTQTYLEAIAFAEEPVMIRIERSSEKFAPKTCDCWVNGRGAELLIRGRWVVLGFFPVGIPVVTKRKYVEVLARTKVDNVSTDVGTTMEENPRNNVDISTSQKAPFSVIRDRNPKGIAWLQALLMERG